MGGYPYQPPPTHAILIELTRSGNELLSQRNLTLVLEDLPRPGHAYGPMPELAVSTHYTHDYERLSEPLRQLRALINERRQVPPHRGGLLALCNDHDWDGGRDCGEEDSISLPIPSPPPLLTSPSMIHILCDRFESIHCSQQVPSNRPFQPVLIFILGPVLPLR